MRTTAIPSLYSRDHLFAKKPALNCYVVCDPGKNAEKLRCKEKLWKVASTASLVAYTILVAVGSILAGLLFPAYIPVAIAGALAFTEPVYKICYLGMRNWAQKNAAKAIVEEGVAKRLKLLPTSTSGLSLALRKIGIEPDEIKLSSLRKLRPAIARYQYWADMHKRWSAKLEKILPTVLQKNQEKEKRGSALREVRILALNLREDTQIAKVHAAFLLHILRNPFLRGDENSNSLFSFKLVPAAERLLRESFNDPSYDLLITLKKKKGKTLGIADLSPLTIAEASLQLA